MNNKGFKWVNLLLVPNGNKVFFTQDGNVIQYLFLSLLTFYKEIPTYELMNEFLNRYSESFKNNNWYSKEHLIQIIIRSSLEVDDKFNLLYNNKLLNPFQLAVSSALFPFQISNDDLHHSLLINNDISLGINYVVAPTLKIKFSKSTSELIKNTTFKEYIYSLDPSEINLFFEIQFITDKVSLALANQDLIFDLLNIDDLRRHEENNLGITPWRYKPINMEKRGITSSLIKEYYKRVSSNLRNIENIIRLKKGFNLVGSLYNETLLFQKIIEKFPNLTVLSQYSPDWLGRQRFDIYIYEFDIAIEYNGKQHYEPVGFYGGKEGFESNLKRDEVKRKKSLKNHCHLIEVKYDEEFDFCLTQIDKIIKERAKV